jgi:hypothetical protein
MEGISYCSEVMAKRLSQVEAELALFGPLSYLSTAGLAAGIVLQHWQQTRRLGAGPI